MIRTNNHARQRHKKLNVIMKIRYDRKSTGNRSESPTLNRTGATTSREVQREAAENTSRPGRPGLDELVPSRYALKVGEIDVMVISDGVLSLPTAMLGHNADPAVRAAWLEDMFLPPDVLEWALRGSMTTGANAIPPNPTMFLPTVRSPGAAANH